MADSPSLDLVELSDFDPAFPVEPGRATEMRRRFSPLLVPSGIRRRGASGCVLKAMNTAGETFALKRANDEGDSADAERLLFEEYRTLTAVSRLPGFPSIYGWARIEGHACIVMEWVEGVTLAEAREALAAPHGNSRIDGQTVAALGCAVLRALRLARSLSTGFVHRDLSLRNIMIRTSKRTLSEQRESGDFDICLIDMGSSALVRQDSSFTVRAGAWRMGTPAYAPPEMLTCDLPGIEALRDSGAIDVYALGSILYDLYTGSGPFREALLGAPSPFRVKMDSEPAPLSPATAADRPLTAVIMACLAREQERRIDADELLDRLEGYLDIEGTRDTVPVGRRRPSPETDATEAVTDTEPGAAATRRLWTARVVSAAVIVIAVVIGYLATAYVIAALSAR